jgi:hypothetical protein
MLDEDEDPGLTSQIKLKHKLALTRSPGAPAVRSFRLRALVSLVIMALKRLLDSGPRAVVEKHTFDEVSFLTN